jgi:hypothetical protein
MPTQINKNTANTFSFIKNQNIFELINTRISSGVNGSTVIVPHVCNNSNAFGAGFAGEVAHIYPEVKANFHMLGQQAKLGHSQFITVKTDPKYRHKIIFANMIAQNKLINNQNKRPLNYAALVYCMNQVRTICKNMQDGTEKSKVEIHAPKFGSGLAGGNWNFISDLINDIWFDLPVYIYSK